MPRYHLRPAEVQACWRHWQFRRHRRIMLTRHVMCRRSSRRIAQKVTLMRQMLTRIASLRVIRRTLLLLLLLREARSRMPTNIIYILTCIHIHTHTLDMETKTMVMVMVGGASTMVLERRDVLKVGCMDRVSKSAIMVRRTRMRMKGVMGRLLRCGGGDRRGLFIMMNIMRATTRTTRIRERAIAVVVVGVVAA